MQKLCTENSCFMFQPECKLQSSLCCIWNFPIGLWHLTFFLFEKIRIRQLFSCSAIQCQFWGQSREQQQNTTGMFCLWKTLKAYIQKPMCSWEAPSSKLLTVCQNYGPELCWGNIWLHRLANVGQLAFSFQASFSTAFLHSHSHAKRSLEIARLQVPRRSERARISQSFKVPCHSGKLILGMSLFCSLWEGRRRHEHCYV